MKVIEFFEVKGFVGYRRGDVLLVVEIVIWDIGKGYG